MPENLKDVLARNATPQMRKLTPPEKRTEAFIIEDDDGTYMCHKQRSPKAYKAGIKYYAEFYYACKAFDVLERLDPDPEFWEGKRGAAVGVFQKVVAKKESADKLQEVVNLLRSSNNPSVEYMIDRVMKKWAKENRVKLE